MYDGEPPSLALRVGDNAPYQCERGTGLLWQFNRRGEILIGLPYVRPNSPSPGWQPSKGGIHHGESIASGRLRENHEEFGIEGKHVFHIADLTDHAFYPIPFPKPEDKYHGVRVARAVAIVGDGAVINLNSWANGAPPEMRDWQHVYPPELMKLCSPHHSGLFEGDMDILCTISGVLAQIDGRCVPEEELVEIVRESPAIAGAFKEGRLAMTAPDFAGLPMSSIDPAFRAAKPGARLIHAGHGS